MAERLTIMPERTEEVLHGEAIASAGAAARTRARPGREPTRIGGAHRFEAGRTASEVGRDEVRQALAGLGLQPSEVDARLAQLSDEDLRRLAANLDQVQAAGAVPQYIWILLAIFLAVSIIVMIF